MQFCDHDRGARPHLESGARKVTPENRWLISHVDHTGGSSLAENSQNRVGGPAGTVSGAPKVRAMEIIEKRAAAKGISVEQAEHDLVQEIPVRRMATPEEVAAAIVWLASERASFITGQDLLVDGGVALAQLFEIYSFVRQHFPPDIAFNSV